jgi:tetratricopeptide repeat protein
MRGLRGLLAFLILCVASQVQAEDRAAARQAYNEGTKYYDLNQYAEALEAFKRAYWNYEEPAFLFNIAQCHRALGRNSEALAFYRSYLRKSSDPPNRAEVQRIIADLEQVMARQKAVSSGPPQGVAETISPPSASEPAAEPSPAPAVVVAAPRPKAEKPAWKRPWVWGVVAGVVAVGIAVGVGVGVGTQPHPPKPIDGAVTF